MNGSLGSEAAHLLLTMPGAPFALITQMGGTALDVRLTSIFLLPEAIERLQDGLDVTPNTDIEGEGVAQFGIVVAYTDDHARLLEAQVNRATPAALAIADTAHHVVGLFRARLNGTDVVRVLGRETAIVKYPGCHGQSQALGQLDNLPLGVGVANVNAADQQWVFGVEQGVEDGAQHALVR